MNINFYKNNTMIMTPAEVHTVESHFTTFAKREDTWESFSYPIKNILNKSASVSEYIYNKYNDEVGLQGGKVLELVLGETFANMLNLTYMGNGVFDGVNYTVTMTGELGKGTGNTHDLVIYDKVNDCSYNAEIKDTVARTGDCDMKYDNHGHLIPSTKSKNWDENWMPILDAFNSHHSVEDYVGHNYNIDDYETCAKVAKSYFRDVDYLFTHKENKLTVIPMKDYDVIGHMFSLKNSEIRCLNGKNAVKVFAPEYCDRAFKNCEFFVREENNCYVLTKDILSVKSRSGGTSSKYNLIPGFRVLQKDVAFNSDGTVTIAKDKILQRNANISVHFTVIASYHDIVKFFEKEN